MENIILKIKGMKCIGCSQRVEKALKNTDGIENVKVDLDSREANIDFNKEIITLKEICKTIEDIGFEVEK